MPTMHPVVCMGFVWLPERFWSPSQQPQATWMRRWWTATVNVQIIYVFSKVGHDFSKWGITAPWLNLGSRGFCPLWLINIDEWFRYEGESFSDWEMHQLKTHWVWTSACIKLFGPHSKFFNLLLQMVNGAEAKCKRCENSAFVTSFNWILAD